MAIKGEVAVDRKNGMLGAVSERRVVFVVLVVSTVLTVMGIGGMASGFYGLSLEPIPEDVGETLPEITRAEREMIISDPLRRPMAAANVVVSGFVLIGSFMLSWRRTYALWWLKQAVIAKLLWIVAYNASLVHHLFESGPFAVPGGLSPEDAPTADLMLTRIIGGGLVTALVHLVALWRATRPDVVEFIASARRA